MTRVAFTAQWRGQPDATVRRFLALLVASMALHAPVSPLIVLLGMLGMVTLSPRTLEAPIALDAIPIELLEVEGTDSARVSKPLPPPPAPPAETLIAEATGGVEPVEAPRDASSEAAEDAATAERDAGVDADEKDAGPPSRIRDPVALAAEEAKVVDSNAVVQLTVYSENIRSHPLGSRMGRLLAQLPQWQDFFGPSGLDPVANIDRLMLVGPDLADSSGLAVLIQHRIPPARLHGAVDALVQRSGGRWVEGGVPTALARADRADRVFVMPSRGLVVVAPAQLIDSARSTPAKARVPAPEGDEALYGALKAPGYAFRKQGAPVRIPDSVESLEFWVRPLADGGGVGRFIAKDGSPEAAQQTLESLRSQAETLRVAGGLAGLAAMLGRGAAGRGDPEDLQLFVAVLGGLEFVVHGTEIHGTVTVRREVVEALMARIERLFRMPTVAPIPTVAGVPAPAPSASSLPSGSAARSQAPSLAPEVASALPPIEP